MRDEVIRWLILAGIQIIWLIGLCLIFVTMPSGSCAGGWALFFWDIVYILSSLTALANTIHDKNK